MPWGASTIGMGSDNLFGNTTGKLVANLRVTGIDPANVDALVMSHAHINHCGAIMAADGSRNFPNAQLFIGEPDFNCWTSDAMIPADYPARPHFLSQAQKNLLPNKDRIHFYKDHEQILRGVTVIGAYGHTVRHSVFIIESAGKRLGYAGGLAHHQVLQLEHPRTQFKYDTDPVQSAESRVRTLDMLATNRIPLIAYHFPWPGLGHVSREGDGFRYYAEPMKIAGSSAAGARGSDHAGGRRQM